MCLSFTPPPYLLRAHTVQAFSVSSPRPRGPSLSCPRARAVSSKVPARDSAALLALLDTAIRMRLVAADRPAGLTSLVVRGGCAVMSVEGEFTATLSTM
jgi:hypothetical protein